MAPVRSKQEDYMRFRQVSRFGAPAIAITALLAAFGCGGTAAPQHSEEEGAAVLRADLPKDLSPYQRKILDDGVLTVAEYQQAALDVVRCHRESGARIVGAPHYAGEDGAPDPWWSSRGQFMYGAGYPDDDPDKERKYHNCEGEYFATINPIWANHIAPTPTEVQQARDMVARCLRDEGIEIQEHPSIQELASVTVPRMHDPVVSRCRRLGAEHLGMTDFVA
jgi:hypothetical protein